MSDTYGFTTTPDDVYIERVAEEAKPETNVISIFDRDTLTNEYSVILLFRRKTLRLVANYYPDLTIGPYTLGDILLADKDLAEQGATDELWAAVAIPVRDGFENKARQGVDQQLSHYANAVNKSINKLADHALRFINLLEDKTIRVTVNSY
jgi:hypothetical protein